MIRGFSTFSLATIFVLANFVLASSALRTIDIAEFGDKPLVIDVDRFGPAHTVKLLDRSRASRFIGDLVHGSEYPNQTVYGDTYQVANNSPNDVSGSLSFTVKGIVNLVGILNHAGSNLVACATPKTLGSSTSVVDIRVPAQTVAVIDVIIAAH